MVGKALDPAQIAALVKKDNETTTRQSRSRTPVTEPRTYDTWFKLSARFAACTNPNCKDPRDNMVGKTMVAMVKESEICRYCFLDGINR